jgi:hypothetical protein
MIQNKTCHIVFAFLPLVIEVDEETVTALLKAAIAQFYAGTAQEPDIALSFHSEIIPAGGEYIGSGQAAQLGDMNPKTLQYLMGHSDISVTMNTYTHLGLEDAVEEMSRMQDVENARKEQEKLNGNTDEVKISKNQFRAG